MKLSAALERIGITTGQLVTITYDPHGEAGHCYYAETDDFGAYGDSLGESVRGLFIDVRQVAREKRRSGGSRLAEVDDYRLDSIEQ